MPEPRILAINPGSTSTKVAVYEGESPLFIKNIKHATGELCAFSDMAEQYHFRKEIILAELAAAGIEPSSLSAIVGRGGLLKPIASGVYFVNESVILALREGLKFSQHASNLAGLIADDIARGLPDTVAYIADPPVVDEMDDIARITGHPLFERKSRFHALNQKAVARRHARAIGGAYEELNLIIAHMGGGTSIGAHRRGMIVDVNDAFDGEGPFTPERSGTLPAGDLARLCFSGDYTYDEVRKMLTGKGGLTAYFGTNDAHEIEKMGAAGDSRARLIMDAMAYQVSKEIGAMFTVLKGDVDAIILTGGIAFNKRTNDAIIERVGRLAPVSIYPGEDEMETLALNGLMVVRGEVMAKEYR
ncbi:MAG TPA: butyrate kinase [Spirochaetota bacterium]|nr:butyrate kinase [Spirochaetota bacterium]